MKMHKSFSEYINDWDSHRPMSIDMSVLDLSLNTISYGRPFICATETGIKSKMLFSSIQVGDKIKIKT